MGSRISIITAYGRHEPEYLREAGRSLILLADMLAEQGDSLEWVIVIDDPSISVKTVEAEVGWFWFTVRVDRNRTGVKGPGPARNHALGLATGEWVLVLDADDRVVTEGALALLKAGRETGSTWVAGRAIDIDADGAFLSDGPPDVYERGFVPTGSFWEHKKTTGGVPFCLNASMIHADAVRAVNGWPQTRMGRAEDTALWAVLTSLYPGWWEPATVLEYRKHAASVTHQPDWQDADMGFTMIDERIQAGTVN